MINLKIEGWRSVSHSYALVNQFQMLAFIKEKLAGIEHIDYPFILPHWSNTQNSAGFNQSDENILNELSFISPAQYIYKIYAPLELKADPLLPTTTFVVTELGLDDNKHPVGFADEYKSMGGKIHTPSHWSKRRLIECGVPDDIIHVIAHAADNSYFFPLEKSEIDINRTNMGFGTDDVVLLNVGTHHWNKGLDVLLKAFAIARQFNPNLKLLLKDQRSTYLMNSEDYVNNILSEYSITDSNLIDSIKLISGHLNLAQLNTLYNIADAYVTPYRAEGFNLPALEAQKCGTPVVATLGGATDDFLSGPGYFAIEGDLFENITLKEHMPINAYIEPNHDQLVSILSKIERKHTVLRDKNKFNWSDACHQILNLM